MQSDFITVITGMRRTGKSTLALQALKDKNFLYFNFDDEVLGQTPSEELNKVLEHALSIRPEAKYLFFDEIQNLDHWELFINRLQRQKKYKIIISGSNSHLLSTELASHLTGRHLSINLFPFSFREILKYKNQAVLNTEKLTTIEKAQLKNSFHLFMQQGGLPETLAYDPKGRVYKTYLRELFDKIITRDIVLRKSIKNVKVLKEIALLALSLFSSQFTYQSIKKQCGTNSVSTVKNYVDFLHETFLISVLEPFSNKPKARISLPKKFYAIDTSISEVIIPKTTIDFGKKLENIVFIELLRRSCEVYSINNSSYEIDFAIREGVSFIQLIQVAWSLESIKTKERETKSLLQAAEEFNVGELLIITEDEEEILEMGNQTIQVVPIWKWLITEPLRG